jgi:Tfp pilus assembly protein PilZ
VAAVRLELKLTNQAEWIKIFDPRDWTVFVPTDKQIESGAALRIDLDVGGWLVTLRGAVVGQRDGATKGVVVALGGTERDKINYLNGFVRGGLLNLREKRRLPIKLSVTYGAVEGPATTFTKDINEEGLFLFTDKPLPETSQIHMLVTVPGRSQPLSLMGKVTHTIIAENDEPPGMGIVFDCDDAQRDELAGIVKDLEAQLMSGRLPTGTLE